jgi:hypothetical protein
MEWQAIHGWTYIKGRKSLFDERYEHAVVLVLAHIDRWASMIST